ncbi:streptomycin biosynthesis protein [Amycolatopsis sp. NPDC052450]|uniref:streptomycin biosynthesis protein n=1 Tax=Amycolatopsis sp. NPDC052450 TaxID=3363937 RepID=UPI0037C8A044
MNSRARPEPAAAEYPATVPGHLDQTVVQVPIASLRPADSPRTAGEDPAHVRELATWDVALPPIVVHRSTMRVIDGMHRLRVAETRGETTIAVRFFDGSADDAFLLAVKANIAHGLSLALADRKAAARRIIGTHGDWSDRAIAALAGLAHKTVGAIRRGSTGENPHSTARIGRDGRVRPLSGVEGRRRAGELLVANPETPVEEVARAAGISTTTVKDVRRRLRCGDDLVPSGQRSGPVRITRPAEETQVWDRVTALRQLRADPSLRFTETGRALLQSLNLHAGGDESWLSLADNVPQHCTGMVVELARHCVADWQRFVTRLEQRGCEGGVSQDVANPLGR